MADTASRRRKSIETRRNAESENAIPCSYWPSRPGEEQYEWEEPRTTKSQLGGTTDGTSSGVDPTTNRVDRLRLLGNGVVPQTAERALRILTERIK